MTENWLPYAVAFEFWRRNDHECVRVEVRFGDKGPKLAILNDDCEYNKWTRQFDCRGRLYSGLHGKWFSSHRFEISEIDKVCKVAKRLALKCEAEFWKRWTEHGCKVEEYKRFGDGVVNPVLDMSVCQTDKS